MTSACRFKDSWVTVVVVTSVAALGCGGRAESQDSTVIGSAATGGAISIGGGSSQGANLVGGANSVPGGAMSTGGAIAVGGFASTGGAIAVGGAQVAPPVTGGSSSTAMAGMGGVYYSCSLKSEVVAGCSFSVPPASPIEPVRPFHIIVEYVPEPGATMSQLQEASTQDCTDGDYYCDNYVDVKQVNLCPTMCETIASNPEGELTLIVMCQTMG